MTMNKIGVFRLPAARLGAPALYMSLVCASLLGASAWCASALAAGYPNMPIKLVVPFSAGGGADNAARILVPPLSKELGASIVIKNEGGASGAIGAEEVARAPKDGYTLLYDASSFSINPIIRKLPYDANKDFLPITQAVSVANVMVVAADSPYQTVQQFVDAARKSPGALTFASYGPGSLAQLAGELLKKDANINIVHVPYKGGAPALVDVMGGQVNMFFANAASSIGYIRGHKLRALAVTSETRMKELPDVPTMEELGFKGFNVLQWNGFFAPAGTPPDVVAKLRAAIQKTLQDKNVQAQLAKLGLETVGDTPEQFKTFIEDETRRWADLVKTNGLKFD